MIGQISGVIRDRLQNLQTGAAAFAKNTAAARQELSSVLEKQSELQRCHCNIRRLGHLLAWNEWNDWQTAGPGRWLTLGHDYRIVFTERMLGELIARQLVFGESTNELGFSFVPDGNPVVSLSESANFIDSITVRFTGNIAIRDIHASCTITIALIVHPMAKDPKPKVQLLRLPQIVLGDTPFAMDLSQDRWRLMHWLENSRVGSFVSELPDFRFGDDGASMRFLLHSVHGTDVLTFFYSRELPRQPLTWVMGSIGRTPPSDDTADISVYVTDDLIASSLSSQFGEVLGILPYDRDPYDSNTPVFLFTYKKEIRQGGDFYLLFWRVKWSYSTTFWPHLWVRLQGNVQNGTGELTISVAPQGAREPAGTAVFARLSGVASIKRIVEEGRGFCFHITKEQTI